MIGSLVERARRVARARGFHPPRTYWRLRSAPRRLLERAGLGPGARRRHETTAGPRGEARLPERRSKRAGPVALFYAINGTGLGHLTRCLAIARRLDKVRPVIVTTSARADVLDQYGIEYVAVPPWETSHGLSRERWNERLHRALRETIADFHPVVVVFDGVAPEPGFTRAIRATPWLGRIGIRRAYRTDGREQVVAMHDAEMDLLIVPHEDSSEDVVLPEGPAVRWVGSIALTDRAEAMTRADARAALGLPADAPAVLVQLGSGAVGGAEEMRARLLPSLAALGVEVVTTSYTPRSETAGHVRTVSRYPLAPLYPAFDLAIAASGYNTFTELMHLGIPSVFVPNEHMRSDDQVARAQRAEREGAALVVRDGDVDAMLVTARKLLGDSDRLTQMSERARALVPRNGAEEAAALVRTYCERILASAP